MIHVYRGYSSIVRCFLSFFCAYQKRTMRNEQYRIFIVQIQLQYLTTKSKTAQCNISPQNYDVLTPITQFFVFSCKTRTENTLFKWTCVSSKPKFSLTILYPTSHHGCVLISNCDSSLI